ncbi:b2 protein [Quercus suber]|uniref:B2 protein n=1 Tax=Quercus suber TaxID=58331 RepID=A0AAW0LJA5_QUESU
MGAGRKTQTHTLKENSQSLISKNSSTTARNLRKSELRGVIFGCKHHTIKECLSKQLFGLPALHFPYIRNISAGLPLFLFNYSDRRLHGIFEAASPGQMNINPYAWTDGSESTPFPAQVKIRIRKQCQPLLEDQFKPIIAENYYEQRLFWFELDQEQTDKLISLFSASSVTVSTSLPSNTQKWSSPFKTVQESGNFRTPSLECNAHPGQARVEWESWDAPGLCRVPALIGELESGPSYPSPKKWSDLFRASNTHSTGKVQEAATIETPALECNARPDQASEESESWDAPCLWAVENLIGKDEETTDEFVSEIDYNEQLHFNPRVDCSSNLAMTKEMSSEHMHAEDTGMHYNEHLHLKPSVDCSSNLAVTKEMSSEHKHAEDSGLHGTLTFQKHKMSSDDTYIPEASRTLETKSSEFQSIVAKVLQEVSELKLFQLKQSEKINSLELYLAELKDRCGLVTEEEFKSCDEPPSELDEKVLIVGGYNGSMWLSAVDSYSPSYDLMESLSPMNFARSSAAAAKLNGEVYLLGGVYGECWNDTVWFLCEVESYNPISNQWVSRPPLNQKKGGLAGVSLNEKIFAIGGGIGVEFFSEVHVFYPDEGSSVERFDPREQSWTRLKNMSERRGSHSLSMLNEKLYAIGGYDGANELSSVEVLDPRVGFWMKGEPMKETRKYAGAVVIGDSIYVMGGVNEELKLLHTVECYKEGNGWQLTKLRGVGKRCSFSAVLL